MSAGWAVGAKSLKLLTRKDSPKSRYVVLGEIGRTKWFLLLNLQSHNTFITDRIGEFQAIGDEYLFSQTEQESTALVPAA